MSGRAETEQSESSLADLSEAILDTGCISWYVENLPKAVQLEFINTQLYDREQGKPVYQIALNFSGLKSIVVCANDELQLDWNEQLHRDEFQNTGLSDGWISFGDHKNDFFDFSHTRTVFEQEAEGEKWNRFRLYFGEGNDKYGIEIVYQTLTLYTPDRSITIAEAGRMYQEWWRYWQEYWKVKGTEEEMEKDGMCEITIPVRQP